MEHQFILDFIQIRYIAIPSIVTLHGLTLSAFVSSKGKLGIDDPTPSFILPSEIGGSN